MVGLVRGSSYVVNASPDFLHSLSNYQSTLTEMSPGDPIRVKPRGTTSYPRGRFFTVP